MIWFLSTLLCTIILLLVLLDYVIRNFTTYNLAKTIVGPKMHPIIGATTFYGAPQHKTFQIAMNYCNIYPNGFAYWTFGIFIYHIYSADAFEKVVTNPKHIQKSFTYKFLHFFLGTGLLTSTGEKWMRRRKLLTPAFHFNILNKFQTTFSEQTALIIKVIREQEANREDGTNLQRLISRFTLNTICESAMGVKTRKIDQLDEYRDKINRMGALQAERLTVPIFVFDFLYKWLGQGRKELSIIEQLHKFTGNIIATKRANFGMEERQEDTLENSDQKEYYGKKQRFAMLDTLLLAERNDEINAAGIQEEVDTFVFEGFDTTMTAITFILFMISHHNDVQEQILDEIKSIGNDYSETKYLDAVIKETMRLYPPVPFIGRILGEDTIIDNIKFPAGTVIHIIIYMLHRDKRYFNDPEKFDPTRFLGNEERHPFAYVPFSAGQRNCIGQKFAMMELRTLICEILRNFKLIPITKIEDIEIIADLVLRTKDPIRIKFVPRH